MVHITIESKYNEKPEEHEIQNVLNYYNVMCFFDNHFVQVDTAILKKNLHSAIANDVVNNGFKSTSLIDYEKIKKFNKGDYEKISSLIEKLNSKSGSSGTSNKGNSVTRHGLDTKIIEGAAKTDGVKNDKKNDDFKKTKEKIKNTINKIFIRVPYMLIGKAQEISKKYNNIRDLKPDKFTQMFEPNEWSEIMQTLEKREFIESINTLINEEVFYESCQK
ncbi:MAG: hypothetical protein LBB45_06560 [Methanobrevibacter sp.]|jgi:hypothetical protein|nr:hypothetical protein [Candidatus Methanovirga basalitermitum]